jgi:hypothetical protein
MGCNKLLNFVDGDFNKPLHAAVQFGTVKKIFNNQNLVFFSFDKKYIGNLEAVKLCLKHGSHINEISEKDNRFKRKHFILSRTLLV